MNPRIPLIAVLLLMGGAPSTAAAQTRDERDAVKLVQDLAAAVVRADGEFLLRNEHPAAVFTLRDGRTLKLEEFVSSNGRTFRFPTIRISDLKVRVHGDLAVATWRSDIAFEEGGKRSTLHNLCTRTLVRDGGRWKSMSFHASPAAGVREGGDGAAGGDEAAERAVAQLIADIHAAMVRGDRAFLERANHEAHVHVRHNGQVETREQYLARVGRSKYQSLRPRDIKVVVHGNHAVATYAQEVRGEEGGSAFRRDEKVTSAFVKQDGRWQRVSFHATAEPRVGINPPGE